MRGIKFRGKRLANDEWCYGSLLIWADGECIILEKSDSSNDMWKREINPDTVGQFTGLYDREGNEIYEGDIVRTSVSKNGIALVEWHCEHAAFVVHMKGSDQWYHLYKGYEKIGNIHDNPSLLEGGLKCFTL